MTLEHLKRGLSALTLLASIGAVGCGSDAAPGGGAPIGAAGSAAPAVTPTPVTPTATAGSTAVVPTGAAGSQAITPPTATTTPTPPTTATMPPNAVNAPGVPCDVAAIVSDACTTCHANPVKYQAPMPLMAHADFMAPAKTDPSKKVFQVIPPRINATDVKLRMPPASGSQVSAANLKVFNDWLAAGAQPTTPSCAITVKGGGGTPTMMPTAGNGATPPTTDKPAAPTTMGGAHNEKIEYNDPMMKCYEFRAHAEGSKTTPYSVSTQPDMYTNFIFTAPWQGMMYARSYRALDGNADVIHHWLLYKNVTGGVESITPSIGAHPDGELVHGWAPGGSSLWLDADVGVEMPSTVTYTLETHHNNKTGSAKPDNSGVEVCVTPMVPKNIASLSWLGTDAIGGTTATGTCAPLSTTPIHILGVSPHMHTKGRHMKAVITRANGMKEVMHDEPFDFAFQHSYDVNTIIMPGESITTTCTFSAPASFGEGTNDEMCYMFTLYYPKLSLTNGNPIGTLIHGPNTCLQ